MATGIKTPLALKKPPLYSQYRRDAETRWRRAAGQGSLVEVGWDGGRHVGVDAEQSRRCLQAHLVDDERTPVAALGDVAAVAEALHQCCPGSAHALGAPTGARRLAGEPVARHGGNHHMERVRCARAVA